MPICGAFSRLDFADCGRRHFIKRGGLLYSLNFVYWALTMQNRLAQENSLYLQQHAENPVDWYPWGEAALAAAQASQKPILVSIGYSACHWCHVMAHECFEDAYIAKLMNQHFICVKVDREERPDVDQVYMEAVQMIQQRGGWPLNVFCLPDGRPFFGGTYFPPKDLGNGLIPWPQVLMRIAEHYRRSKSELVENAEAIQKNILAANQANATGGAESTWDPSQLLLAAQGICGNHDDQYGGFGGAPKFPPSMSLNFLNALRATPGISAEQADLSGKMDLCARTTLKAMAHGGLFDQFGGGFTRYSVDAHWLIPHFEKMLYDNALLIDAYTRAHMADPQPIYAAVVAETVEWLRREMRSDSGGFYSALDADSGGEEGAYYVWTPEEVDSVLGFADSKAVCAAYNITFEGNFEQGRTNPAMVEADFAVRTQLAAARAQLRQHREQTRTAPGKDQKMSAFWNGLLMRSLADAGFYFNRPDWLQLAREAADFIWDAMICESADGIRIKAVYYENAGASVDGFLHDYAVLADAFLALSAKIDWLEAGTALAYQQRAQACLDAAIALFEDPHSVGYYFTAEGAETPVARRKEWFDNATPAGNSILLHALSAMDAVCPAGGYRKRFSELLPAYSSYAKSFASGVAHALEAIASDTNGIIRIQVAAQEDLELLRAGLAKLPWQRCFVHLAPVGQQSERFHLCRGQQCYAPTNELRELLAMLDTRGGN